jgi:hypothetical protein
MSVDRSCGHKIVVIRPLKVDDLARVMGAEKTIKLTMREATVEMIAPTPIEARLPASIS